MTISTGEFGMTSCAPLAPMRATLPLAKCQLSSRVSYLRDLQSNESTYSWWVTPPGNGLPSGANILSMAMTRPSDRRMDVSSTVTRPPSLVPPTTNAEFSGVLPLHDTQSNASSPEAISFVTKPPVIRLAPNVELTGAARLYRAASSD